MVGIKTAPTVFTCEPRGLVAASLRPDGSVVMHDLTCSSKHLGRLRLPVRDNVPISSLVLSPKAATVAACSDLEGTVTVLAPIASPTGDIALCPPVVTTLKDPPRPIALDASDHFVVAAGGQMNELVVYQLQRPQDIDNEIACRPNAVPTQSADLIRHSRKNKKLKVNRYASSPISRHGLGTGSDATRSVCRDMQNGEEKVTSSFIPPGPPSYSLIGNPQRYLLAQYHRNVVSAVALAPDNCTAILCCEAINRIDLVTGNLIEQFAGHKSMVTAIRFLPQKQINGTDSIGDELVPRTLFATACAGDNFISIWCPQVDDLRLGDKTNSAVRPNSGRKRRMNASVPMSEPFHTLVAPEKGVHSLAVDYHSDPFSWSLSVAALLPSGAIAVWKNWDILSSSRTTKCSLQVLPSPGDLLFFAGFCERGYLCVGHGQAISPTLFRVPLENLSGNYLLPPDDADRSTSPEHAAGFLQSPTFDSRMQSAAHASIATQSASLAPQAGYRKEHVVSGDAEHMLINGQVNVPPSRDAHVRRNRSDTTPANAVSYNAVDGFEDSRYSKPALEESFKYRGFPELLQTGTSNRWSSLSNFEAHHVSSAGTVESFINMISKAVRLKDEESIYNALASVAKPSQVRQMVAQLPVEFPVNEFFDLLTTCLSNRPEKSELLLPWIRAVLLEHANALMDRQDKAPLDKLSRELTFWVEGLPSWRRLEGQLELVLAQAERFRSARTNFRDSTTPVVDYVDRTASSSSILPEEPSGNDVESDEDADETGDCSEEDTDSSTWEEREHHHDDDADQAVLEDTADQKSKNLCLFEGPESL